MTEWVPPTPAETKRMVLQVLVEHPDRHGQGDWIGNVFADYIYLIPLSVPVEDLRPYASQDIPPVPADPDRPLCGTKGCVAGWAAILASPPGTTISRYYMLFPDRTSSSIADYAAMRMDLDFRQAHWLFCGARSYDQVVEALQILIDDPHADLPLIFCGG
jgi:hypothetical protein